MDSTTEVQISKKPKSKKILFILIGLMIIVLIIGGFYYFNSRNSLFNLLNQNKINHSFNQTNVNGLPASEMIIDLRNSQNFAKMWSSGELLNKTLVDGFVYLYNKYPDSNYSRVTYIYTEDFTAGGFGITNAYESFTINNANVKLYLNKEISFEQLAKASDISLINNPPFEGLSQPVPIG